MPSKEIGAIFNPESHGPGQMRFGFNGSPTLEADPDPVSELNRRLLETGMFPDLTPEDLPMPKMEFSGNFLQIIQRFDELGCIKFNGEFINRSDEDGVLGKTVWGLMKEMKVLVAPTVEDENSPQESDLLSFLKSTPLVNAVITADPPKGKRLF